MIRRIRVLANAIRVDLVDGIRIGFNDFAGSNESQSDNDPALDVLVRHAMVSSDSSEADTGKVWKKLSGRVRGPFGQIAVEGPNISIAEASCMQGLPAPFSVGTHTIDAASGQMSAREKTISTLLWSPREELSFR
ncbi:MAG: hypothetical protein M3014_15390 [Chloroflexota bacterium]|nr:hypothetical protein [Chloroflexota bacterium]